jgi:hypothetical protein
MKVNNINSEFKHYISTMVIFGIHMHKFSVSKDMKKIEKGHGSRKGGGAFMSNTNYMIKN